MLVVHTTCAFCNKTIEEVITEQGILNYDHETPSCCDQCLEGGDE